LNRWIVTSLHCYIVKVASLDNLLFVLLIAAAALFQLLSKAVTTKAGKKQSDKPSTPPIPPRPPQIPRAPIESDADRIRKFLEALGQPPSSTPPPPIAPRTDIPPRRLAPVQPPPVIPRAWGLPREQRRKPEAAQKESPSPEGPRHVERPFPPPVPVAAAQGFELHESAIPPGVQQQPIVKTSVEAYAAAVRPVINRPDLKADIAGLLASKSGLREAIILREIFGPPPGLRDPDATL
jgi:hypothetical protein